MKILIIKHHDENTHNTFYTEENIKRLEGIAELSYLSITDPEYESKFKKELEDTDICMTCWGIEPFSKELLDSAKKLKMIAHTGGSATHVYSEEIRRRGIIILSGNKFFAEEVLKM